MVYPEVITEVAVGIVVSMLLALLGAALLLLTAGAQNRARVAKPVRVEQPQRRFERVRSHLPEPPMSFGATRAPPPRLPREQAVDSDAPLSERG